MCDSFDAGAQGLIAQAHHEAITEVIDLMEREVAAVVALSEHYNAVLADRFFTRFKERLSS